MIRTPDQRLRVFISSTMRDLAPERAAVRDAVARLHLTPVLFELGARPHPPRDLYQAYLEQSHIFVGIYWQSYGWIAPGMEISGLEDEYRSAGSRPKLIYRKEPASERDERLKTFLREIADSGEVSYKVFSTPEELAAVVQADLALLLTESFEATRGRAAVRSTARQARLPDRTGSLIGRSREIEELTSLLLRDAAPIVTLTGAGGIGKTRLAIEVARALETRFADGVRFVSLASLQDAGRLPSELARALGLREEEHGDVVDTLKAWLAETEVLLVLDNFEQILDAAPVVADLVTEATMSKVLVTSRAQLQLSAEQEYAVQPLDVPQAETAAARLTQYAAVELFIERARLVRPDFTVDDDNAPAVAEICARLDGLPLAIELAAARVKILPPQALLKKLTSRLAVLTGGPRDVPQRQQTLRGAIDWSHQLLDEDERRVFARLSVFAGGASLEAIDDVCAASEGEVFDQVSSLVDKNLLRSTQDLEGEPRLTMLQTVQEYAAEQLAARGETASVAVRHADFFLRFAREGEQKLRGRHQKRWVARLDLEHDNLRTALGWFAEQDDPDSFLKMFYALHKFWLVRGYLVAARAWADIAIRGAENGSPTAAALGLFAAGGVSEAMGDDEQAATVWTEALEICRANGDTDGMATITNVFGRLAFQEGDMDKAERLFQDSLSMFSEIGDREGIGQCLNNLGRVATVRGEFNEALRLLNECLELFKLLDHQQWIARALLNIGTTHRNAGDASKAANCIRESTRLWSELGGDWDLVDCLEDWAANLVVQGRHDEAARILGASEAARDRLHAPQWTFDAQLLEPYWVELRTALGEEAFEKGRREGRGLSLNSAVESIVDRVD